MCDRAQCTSFLEDPSWAHLQLLLLSEKSREWSIKNPGMTCSGLTVFACDWRCQTVSSFSTPAYRFPGMFVFL